MKKILSLVLVLLLTVFLSGCEFLGGGTETTKVDLDEVFLNVESQIQNKDAIQGDITLPTKFGTVVIVWSSDHPLIIDNQGKVTRPDEDTEVILSCTLANGETQKTYQIRIKVLAKGSEENYQLAHLPRNLLGKYEGDDVVVIVEESRVTVTDPTGKTLVYDLYVDGNEYFIVEEGIVIVCTFTDTTVTNVKGTFTKVSDGPVVTEKTVKEVLAGTVGETYKVSATVIEVSAESILVSDGTDYIFAYFGNTYEKDLEAGMQVTLEGVTSLYGGRVQFNKPTYTKGDKTSVSHPNPVAINASDIDRIAQAESVDVQYVKLNAILKQSGKYYNLIVDGASATASLCSPATDLSALLDKEVEVTGYLVYVTASGSNKYVYIMYTDVTLADNPLTLAHVAEANRGKYEGSGVVVTVEESKVTVVDPTGKVLEYALYEENGEIFFLEEGTKVVCTFTDTTVTNAKGTFTKVNETEPLNTIAEVLAMDTGSDARFEATVIAVSGVSYLVKDDTGYILVYIGSSFEKDVKAGDKVLISGKTSVYAETKQMNNPTYEVIGENLVEHPTATELTAAMFDALANNTATSKPVYVTAQGQLKISGRYNNLIVDGTTIQGSILTAQDLSELADHTVTVKGYYLYVNSSSSQKFVNIIITEIEDGGGTHTETPTSTLAEVLAGTVGESYKVSAMVVAVSAESALVTDGTDYIYVYFGSTFAKDLQVGMQVTLEGATSVYGGRVQFNKPTYTKGDVSQVTYPNPKAVINTYFEELAQLENIEVEYISLEGHYVQSGKYHNITVYGTDVYASLCSPAEDLSAFNDKDIKVTGYLVYLTTASNGNKYAYVMYTEISEASESVHFEASIVNDLGKGYGYKVFNYLDDETVISELSYANGVISGDIARPFGNMVITVYQLDASGAYPEDVDAYVAFTDYISLYQEEVVLHFVGEYDVTAGLSLNEDESYLLTVTIEITDKFQNPNLVMRDLVLFGYENGDFMTGEYHEYSISENNGIRTTHEGNTYTVTANISKEVVSKFANDYYLQDSFKGLLAISVYAELYANEIDYSRDGYLIALASASYNSASIETSTVAEVLAMETGSEAKVNATVVAKSSVSFLVKDETGYILCYFGSNSFDVTVGDKLEIIGTTSSYANTIQFSQPEYNLLEHGTVEHPIAITLSASDIDAFLTEQHPVGYYTISGTLQISGNYNNLVIEGTDVKGSIITTADLSRLNGCEFSATGYYLYITGSSQKYFSIILTAYEYDDSSLDELAIADVLAGTAGETYTVKGQVAAITKDGLLLTDNANYIYLYMGSGFDSSDLELGMELTVTGSTSLYGGRVQFSRPRYVIGEVKPLTAVTYTEYLGYEFGEFARYNPLFGNVKAEGVLKQNGNYYNIILDNTTVQASILTNSDLSEYVDKAIVVSGFFAYTNTSNNILYAAIVAFDIKEASETVTFSARVLNGLSDGCALVVVNEYEGTYNYIEATYENGVLSANITRPVGTLWVDEYKKNEAGEVNYDQYVRGSTELYLNTEAFALYHDDEFSFTKSFSITDDGTWNLVIDATVNSAVVNPNLVLKDIVLIGYKDGVGETSTQGLANYEDANITSTYSNGTLHIEVVVPASLVQKYASEYYYNPNYKGGLVAVVNVTYYQNDIDVTYFGGDIAMLYFFNSFLDVVQTEGKGTIESPLTAVDAYNLANYLDAGIWSYEYFYIEGVVADEPTSDSCNFNLTAGENTLLVYGLLTADGEYKYGTNTNKISGLPVKTGDKVLLLAQVYHFANSSSETLELKAAQLIKVNDQEVTYELIQIADQPTHTGTLEDPLSVSDAVILASKLDASTNQMSEAKYYIQGKVNSITNENYCNFTMTEGELSITVYGLAQDADFTQRYGMNREIKEIPVAQGDTVLLYGYVQNYSGTLEIAKAQLLSDGSNGAED